MRPLRAQPGHLLLAAALVLLAAGRAGADHLVVGRHALVKDAPERSADTLLEVERGEKLQLARDSQTDGYYAVTLEGGRPGWIYRTFVRRHPGDLAPVVVAEPGTDLASPFAYGSLPVTSSPHFPAKVLRKPQFVVGYSDERRNPLWVCYAIGPATDLVAYPRKAFATDRDTVTRVTHEDYTGSGFSRGHMAPRFAISSRFGQTGNDATFVMSNVCPQFQDFNDGQWGDLEELIAGRKSSSGFTGGWADEFEKVWVTVGPVFDEDREPLTTDVEVPSAFYCIVVDEEPGGPRALAFIMEHADERAGDPRRALSSIREIERRTGLDFFSALPDDVESVLESTAASGLWASGN